MTRENAARKVRALLATASEGSGATDPERATAKRLADQLIAQYRLNERQAPPPPPVVNPAWVFTSDGVRFTVKTGSTTSGGTWTVEL